MSPLLAFVVVALSVAALTPCAAFGSFEIHDVDARSAGLASHGPVSAPAAGVGASRDTIARGGEVWGVGASAFELYGLAELRGFRVTAERRGPLSVILGTEAFGADVYTERSVDLALERALGGGASGSIRLRACGLSGAGVEESWACAVDAGGCLDLLGRLHVEFAASNVGDATIGGSPLRSGTTLVSVFSAGSVLVCGSVATERGVETAASIGCEAALSRWMRVRSGMSVGPCAYGLGVGVDAPGTVAFVGGCTVDVAWQWHPELGVSTFVSLSLGRPVRGGGSGDAGSAGHGGARRRSD